MLLERLRDLAQDWDPLDLFVMGVPRDEYDTYLFVVHRMLLAGATVEEALGYLSWVHAENSTWDEEDEEDEEDEGEPGAEDLRRRDVALVKGIKALVDGAPPPSGPSSAAD